VNRCAWVPADDPLYVAYHDEEWGVPVRDDRALFELLNLEGAQAGLSWSTILRVLRVHAGGRPRRRPHDRLLQAVGRMTKGSRSSSVSAAGAGRRSPAQIASVSARSCAFASQFS